LSLKTQVEELRELRLAKVPAEEKNPGPLPGVKTARIVILLDNVSLGCFA